VGGGEIGQHPPDVEDVEEKKDGPEERDQDEIACEKQNAKEDSDWDENEDDDIETKKAASGSEVDGRFGDEEAEEGGGEKATPKKMTTEWKRRTGSR
jgi:hypothetical protein